MSRFLKSARVILALVFFCCLTFLFLDFRNTGREWNDWFRLTQIIPAIFAASVVSIIVLAAVTIIFGRIYCSVICPLGVLQDIIDRVTSIFRPRKTRNQRFTYSKGYPWLRNTVFVLFFAAMIIGCWWVGVRAWAALVEPYSAYGRIASSILGPVYDAGNNMLADWSVDNDSTTFWHVTAAGWGGLVFWIALATLTVLFITVISAGRVWCNTMCPAGTLLGFLSRYSRLAPVINRSKCVKCRKCERDCKAQCIDITGAQKIDYSRCVTCFDCLGQCKFDALSYTLRSKSKNQDESEKK